MACEVRESWVSYCEAMSCFAKPRSHLETFASSALSFVSYCAPIIMNALEEYGTLLLFSRFCAAVLRSIIRSLRVHADSLVQSSVHAMQDIDIPRSEILL